MFFKTILREWSQLDQYRVNKFYTLIRVFTHKTLQLALNNGWGSTFSTQLSKIIENEVLLRRPNGIRFHMVDIFIPELTKVTNGELGPAVVVGVTDIFLRCLLRQDDSVFLDRVVAGLYQKFLAEFAAENSASGDDLDHALYPLAVTLALQKRIFDTAADETTPDFARRRLYALHKEFAQKSGHAFVSDDILAGAAATKEAKTEAAPATSSRKKVEGKSSKDKDSAATAGKRKRAKNESAPADDSAVAAAASETAVAPVSAAPVAKKSKKPVPAAAAAAVETPVPVEEVAVPLKSALKGAAKRKASAVSAVAEAGDAETPSRTSPQPFIASVKFSGRKEGFVFHKGASGVGYYLDTPKAIKGKGGGQVKKGSKAKK